MMIGVCLNKIGLLSGKSRGIDVGGNLFVLKFNKVFVIFLIIWFLILKF